MTNNTVGKNIAEARKRARMTQEELAQKVGYKTKSAINKIEMGKRDLPQKKIATFAAALGTTPGHLLGWDVAPAEAGALAARVLKDPEVFQFMRDFMTLSEADQYALRLVLASMKAKKEADASASAFEVGAEVEVE